VYPLLDMGPHFKAALKKFAETQSFADLQMVVAWSVAS
jgi:hypothetical protein